MKGRLFVVPWRSVAVFMTGCLICELLCAGNAHAQTAPFYQGKTIRIVVGSASGGLYDEYARVLSRYMPKYIPGNPSIIVQNMPGAGSLVAANYVYGVAKPDGLTLGMPNSTFYLDQLLGRKEVNFDVRKFTFIGSVDQRDLMIYMRADAPWKSIEDIIKAVEPPKCGSTGTADLTTILTVVAAETLGAKFSLVRGYQSASQIDLAMEKGEVYCRGTGIPTHFAREPYFTWHKNGFDRHILQTGAQKDPRLGDAPTLNELMDNRKTPEMSRGVARVLLNSGTLGHPMIGTPGIPSDRVSILRDAYLKALKEPEVLAEARKRGLEMETLGGEQLEKEMHAIMDQPREVIERVKKLTEQGSGG